MVFNIDQIIDFMDFILFIILNNDYNEVSDEKYDLILIIDFNDLIITF